MVNEEPEEEVRISPRFIGFSGAKAQIGKRKTRITLPTTNTTELMEVLNVHIHRSRHEGKLKEVLKYLDEKYEIGKLYYPGSGWHITPKEALGKDRVTHLSLEENADFVEGGYFGMLGEGVKVKGDYRFSPFKDKSFDATLIHDIPRESAIDSLSEFRRVTKEDGLIIVVRDYEQPHYADHIPNIVIKNDGLVIKRAQHPIASTDEIAEYMGGRKMRMNIQKLLMHYTETCSPKAPKYENLERVKLPPELEKFEFSPEHVEYDIAVYRNRPAKSSQKQISDF